MLKFEKYLKIIVIIGLLIFMLYFVKVNNNINKEVDEIRFKACKLLELKIQHDYNEYQFKYLKKYGQCPSQDSVNFWFINQNYDKSYVKFISIDTIGKVTVESF